MSRSTTFKLERTVVPNTSKLALLAVMASIGLIGLTNSASAQVSADESGHLEQSHENWRASNLIGNVVYTDKGKSIGAIRDLLIDDNGNVRIVILAVGSFLGMSKKNVEIPFSKLKFRSARPGANGQREMSPQTIGNKVDYSAVLPNVTMDSLNAMPDFDFKK